MIPPATNPPSAHGAHSDSEESRTSGGQRRVNLIWEVTQSMLALLIVTASMASALIPASSPTAQVTLTNAMFVVIGFYFGRTNHQRTGGVQGGR
jgi:hypothetical protein